MILKTTFRSKILVLAGAAALMIGASAAWATSSTTTTTETTTTQAAPLPKPSAAQIELAKAYIASVPVEDDVKAALGQLSKGVSADQRVLFNSIADNSIDYAKLKGMAIETAAETFTPEELKAMTAFYSSPEGKSSRGKMTGFELKMQPVVTDVLQTFVMKLQQNNVIITPSGQ